MAARYKKEGPLRVESASGHARVGVAGAIVALATVLFVTPALADTASTLEGDGSVRTTYREFEHTSGTGTPVPPGQQTTGAVSPIGPFVGDKSEGFFTQVIGDPFPVCVEDRVFDNMADLCSSGGCAHITPGWAFDCLLLPHVTPLLYGSCSGFSVYTFDVPVQKFGGYFASNAPGPPSGTARFYDALDQLIDSADITIAPGCAWTWSGWEALAPIISRVEVVSDSFGGAFIQMDDMEIAFGGPIPVESSPWGRIKAAYRTP